MLKLVKTGADSVLANLSEGGAPEQEVNKTKKAIKPSVFFIVIMITPVDLSE
jgi:hypothetical protein